jgi:hypothetical protein
MTMVLVHIVEHLATKDYSSQLQTFGSNDNCDE